MRVTVVVGVVGGGLWTVGIEDPLVWMGSRGRQMLLMLKPMSWGTVLCL